MKKILRISLFFLLSVNFLFLPRVIFAENNFVESSWKADIVQSATLGAFSDQAPLGAIKSPAVIKLENLGRNFPLPWNYEILSDVYQFDFVDKGSAYNASKPLKISISYGQVNNYYKQIFFYDAGKNRWQPLPSVDDPDNKKVTADIHLPFARLAVLANDEVLAVGKASWYRHKGSLFAASPDFKSGTVLKVTNLDNGKSVDVTVNDYGPDRSLHPDRVVDLDAVAFNKIASTKAGLIRVKIEAKKIISPDDQVKLAPAGEKPEIDSGYAVLISESDGRVLFERGADKVSPLASLTKLVAAKIFLDTGTDLKKEVTYSSQDEKYNYEYCRPWESASLKVTEGETMTAGDLLYAALVGSANNAVESLVRASGLSRPDFIARMNVQAKNWGASSTVFVEPTGLSPDNVSSPRDYAIMARELFKDRLLEKISTTAKYSFTTINTKKKHNLKNTNGLVLSSGLKIIGSKTGYLDEAGYCLMTRAAGFKDNLIAVTFNSPTKAASQSDHDKLLRYGLKQLER